MLYLLKAWDSRILDMTFPYIKCEIHKYKVLKRPNMCYIFEKHGIQGYRIWHSHVSNVKYTNTRLRKYANTMECHCVYISAPAFRDWSTFWWHWIKSLTRESKSCQKTKKKTTRLVSFALAPNFRICFLVESELEDFACEGGVGG